MKPVALLIFIVASVLIGIGVILFALEIPGYFLPLILGSLGMAGWVIFSLILRKKAPSDD